MRKAKISLAARVGRVLLISSGISLLSAGLARADGYILRSPDLVSASSTASASIIESQVPPQLQPATSRGHGSTAATDSEGRNLSVSVPANVTLYGLARAEEIAAHTVLTPAGRGAARLGLELDQAVAGPHNAGGYIGVVRISLDYN